MFLLIFHFLPHFLTNILISIHPMFLLIPVEICGQKHKTHFNTSHVSINLTFVFSVPCVKLDFNTSHVSINRQVSIWGTHPEMISIHPMFLLIVRRLMRRSLPRKISIHPMFLLIRHGACKHGGRSLISIHPMFLLICLPFLIRFLSFQISIHPMFLLISVQDRMECVLERFQYIPCFY